jgi:hypothetical protein
MSCAVYLDIFVENASMRMSLSNLPSVLSSLEEVASDRTRSAIRRIASFSSAVKSVIWGSRRHLLILATIFLPAILGGIFYIEKLFNQSASDVIHFSTNIGHIVGENEIIKYDGTDTGGTFKIPHQKALHVKIVPVETATTHTVLYGMEHDSGVLCRCELDGAGNATWSRVGDTGFYTMNVNNIWTGLATVKEGGNTVLYGVAYNTGLLCRCELRDGKTYWSNVSQETPLNTFGTAGGNGGNWEVLAAIQEGGNTVLYGVMSSTGILCRCVLERVDGNKTTKATWSRLGTTTFMSVNSDNGTWIGLAAIQEGSNTVLYGMDCGSGLLCRCELGSDVNTTWSMVGSMGFGAVSGLDASVPRYWYGLAAIREGGHTVLYGMEYSSGAICRCELGDGVDGDG